MRYEDQGASVIDVQEETDTNETLPCMIQKSDGASLYGTTELATLSSVAKIIIRIRLSMLLINVRTSFTQYLNRSAKRQESIRRDRIEIALDLCTMNGKEWLSLF